MAASRTSPRYSIAAAAAAIVLLTAAAAAAQTPRPSTLLPVPGSPSGAAPSGSLPGITQTPTAVPTATTTNNTPRPAPPATSPTPGAPNPGGYTTTGSGTTASPTQPLIGPPAAGPSTNGAGNVIDGGCRPETKEMLEEASKAGAEAQVQARTSAFEIPPDLKEMTCLDSIFGISGWGIPSIPTIDDIINAAKSSVCAVSQSYVEQMKSRIIPGGGNGSFSFGTPPVNLPGGVAMPTPSISVGTSTGATPSGGMFEGNFGQFGDWASEF